MRARGEHDLNRWSRRRLLAAAAGAPGLLLIAGCGGGSSTPSGSGDTAPKGGSAASQKLTFAIPDDISSLDPAKAFDTWSTAVVHAVTRRLVDYDLNGKLVPDLAEKWDRAADGKSYTFHLRPDIQYADGAAIEAGHFKAAIERVLDAKTASPGASFYSGFAALEAPEARTLVVRLKAPDPTLLNLMGLTFAAPFPPGQDPAKPAASGPYMLAEYAPGTRVVLKRNTSDSQSAGWADEIEVQLSVAQPLQLTRFKSGEVDLLPGIPPAEYSKVLRDPAEKDNLAQGVVNQTWYFGMNVTRAPWDNPKVRRAALLAINRDLHARFAGAGQVANGILPPHVPGYDPQRTLPAPNVEEAKKLLAEAGFPNGIPDSQKTVMWLANSEQYQRHAQAIQSDLRAAGIPVDLRPVTFSEYRTGYRTKADCWYGGWYPDFPDAGNFMEPVFHAGSSSNAAHYKNPKVDQLLDRAHTMPEGDARSAVYREAEDLLLEDLPWIPLYFEVETRYFRDGVQGVVVHPVWRHMLTGIKKT
jgi:ABC-type transport system substrate-binding protein